MERVREMWERLDEKDAHDQINDKLVCVYVSGSTKSL